MGKRKDWDASVVVDTKSGPPIQKAGVRKAKGPVSPYAKDRASVPQGDVWRCPSLREQADASPETKEFFARMSESGSPASLREARITDTDIPEVVLQDLSPPPENAIARIRRGLEETFLLARLTFRLLYYLGLGWRWNVQAWRLILYAVLLLPGFIQMGIFYLCSKRVLRSIPYGPKSRQRLDIYVPRHHWSNPDICIPVVIYVTGGAWTIGYKAWGSLLGRRLSKNGVIVCCLDYRNFPQGTVMEMLEDVNTGISWVLSRIRYYGGDPHRIHLVGQSCGAQLTMMSLLTQAEQQKEGVLLPGGSPRWRPEALRSIIGVSGVYNCYGLADHLHSRGLYHSLLDKIMSVRGVTQLKLFSPTYCIKGINWGTELPRILLLHGDKDDCAPMSNAEQYYNALLEAGANVELKTYQGQTHTSPLIENPMKGGQDRLSDDILAAVTGQDDLVTNQMALCPAILIKAAALICPF